MLNNVPTLESLISGAGHLGSLPASFQLINEVANNPVSSAEQIALIVEKDPGLAVRILRIANSPFYSFPSRVTTISHAVVLIGIKQLRDLVLATTVIELFKGISPDLVDMESFWRHSIATGIIARILATRLAEQNTEYYFIAGLLHDVGSLLMYQNMPAPCREVMQKHAETGQPLHYLEADMLGYHHAQVGGRLLQGWNLPPDLAVPVMGHHLPDPNQPHYRETSIVHGADMIADALEFGSNGERNVPPLSKPAWEAHRLDRISLVEIAPEIEFQFKSVVRIFLSDLRATTTTMHRMKTHVFTKPPGQSPVK